MVDGYYGIPIGKVLHLADLFRERFPGLFAAPVSVDVILYVVFDKMHGAVLAHHQLFEGTLDDAAHQLLPTGQLADHPGYALD